MNNIIVFDVETGGLDCELHPITQIGIIAVESKNYNELLTYETFVKPYNNLEITQKALQSSMLSMTDILKGIDSETLLNNLIHIFKEVKIKGSKSGNPILAGHNVGFDIGFLYELFKFHKKRLSDFVSQERIDTLIDSRRRWKGNLKSDDVSNFNLKSCCRRYNIDLVDAHGAMQDTKATLQLMIKLNNDFSNSIENTEDKKEVSKESKVRKYYQF
jgi:DNA polymerase III epsilon subunit-like protein